ncbi:MAG: molybdopterin converting factor subunit 1 [Thermomicrobiales bacterium]|nr:molybdopterin converting factor subunit 1 [Thermomicrobiales bacterium]
MDIDIRYFAMIREIVGRAAERREVPAGATIGDLFDQLAREHPRLERLKPVTMLMVNQEYVPATHPLTDGDEVAFIPPVSGGAQTRFRVQSEPIDAREVEALVAHPGAGAIATFTGTVRDHGRGRQVTHLDYEAYAPAAEKMLAQISDEIRERWGIEHVAITHRVGSLAIGEASVVISVASAHRDAAFESCRYAIERIKEIVPIWKKEHYVDGATWLGSEHDYQVEIGRLSR